MLILLLHNDGTGDGTVDNYDGSVLITTGIAGICERISAGRVERHRRRAGWRALVRRAARDLEPSGGRHLVVFPETDPHDAAHQEAAAQRIVGDASAVELVAGLLAELAYLRRQIER